jgi:4-diphosphocytidyl-2-C-methyl-D-erythritol kinase
MNRMPAAAKINLALVVGQRRPDGLHEVVTVLQRVDLCDSVTVQRASALVVEGYRKDTLVRSALARLAAARVCSDADAFWRVRLEKRIPLASGLGGGSADAAAALTLANRTLGRPLAAHELADLAAAVGADVPFFLAPGPKLAQGGGERLQALELPQDYWVLIALPRLARKRSTADVYARFDQRGERSDFAEKRAALLEALDNVRRPRDFAALPPNDLAVAAGRPRLVDELLEHGAFRSDVSGAGPALYGLFHHRADAERAARRLRTRARVWVVPPVW